MLISLCPNRKGSAFTAISALCRIKDTMQMCRQKFSASLPKVGFQDQMDLTYCIIVQPVDLQKQYADFPENTSFLEFYGFSTLDFKLSQAESSNTYCFGICPTFHKS